MFKWVREKLEHLSEGYSNAPIAISVEQYFPVDIKHALQIRRNYIRFIKNVKKEIGQNKYNPLWLSKFRRIFELSQQKELSQSLFNSGLEIIQKSMNESTEPLPIDTTVPAELSRWIKYAKKHEIDEGCVLQQFRIAFYKGILQVTRNKITPDEWIKNLSTHKDSLPKKISGEIFQLLEDFNERYFSWVEQDAYTFYEVPVLVYQKFFSAIEEEIANYNVVEIEEEVGSEPDAEETDIIPTTEQVKNFFSYINESVNNGIGTFRKAFSWASNHKMNILLWWLAASSRSVVNAQSTDPFLTVLSGNNNEIIAPYGILQSNVSSLWIAGGYTDVSGVSQMFFSNIINGTQVSTLLMKNNIDVAYDFVNTNDGGLGFSGSSTNRAVFGKIGGNSPFTKVFGGINYDYANTLQVTNTSKYVVFGSTSSFGGGSYDAFTAEFDSTGNFEWGETVGGAGSDSVSSSTKTSDGGYVGGGFTGSIGAGGLDFFVFKYINRILSTVRVYGGINNERVSSIIELPNGDLLLGGFTQSFSAVGLDALIVRTDSLGNLKKGYKLGGIGDESVSGLQKTVQGVRLVGSTTSDGVGNPKKMFIADLIDLNGNFTLSSVVTVDGSGNDGFIDIKPMDGGGYALTGKFNNSAVVAQTDINGVLASNCTTDVTYAFSFLDITGNITVTIPGMTGVSFVPTIFNVIFRNSSASLVAENPCSFPIPTTTSSATTGNPTTSVVATSSSATSFTPTTSSQGSTSSDGNGPTTVNPSSSSSGSTVNVIAVVGGVAGAVLLLGFGAYLKRRKSGNKINDTDNNGSDSASRANVTIDKSVTRDNDKDEIIYNTVPVDQKESIYNTVPVDQKESIYNTMDGSVEEGKRTSASRGT